VEKRKVVPEEGKKVTNLAFPKYSHDTACYNDKRERAQPGPGAYSTEKPIGK